MFEWTVPKLIGEKIKILSRIKARNILVHGFRGIVSEENEKDSERIKKIEVQLARMKRDSEGGWRK